MAIIVNVNGVDKTSYLGRNSLRVVKKADHLNSVSLYFNCKYSDWFPKNGQDITVYDGATQLFGGVINRIDYEKQEPSKGTATYVKVNVQSNGYMHIPARRTVTVYYENWTAGDIVRNLVDFVLNNASYDDNITKGSITSGATIAEYNGFCKSVKDIFDDMARESGCKWYIDDSKTINFITDDTVTTADHTIDESASFTDYVDLRVSTALDNYCNKVFVKGSADDNYITASDTSEITLRASAEGTAYSSGVYGRVLQASDVSDTSSLTTIANNELKKYGFEPQQLSFRSFTSTWTAGTKIQVNLPAFGITANTSFLIDEVNAWRYDTNIMAYDVHCTKRDTSDFSTQREAGGYDFINDLVLSSKGKGGGATGSVYSGAIQHYQATNTATVTITSSETTVATKSFILNYPSDIHVTFSAHLIVTAAITITAKTYLQEGAATAARTYQPIHNLSGNTTFTYCEQMTSISAGSSVITIKLSGDTGTTTVSANFSALNISVFPLTVTATATANLTYQEWESYPDSQVSLQDFPYQAIVNKLITNAQRLVCSAEPLGLWDCSGTYGDFRMFDTDEVWDDLTIYQYDAINDEWDFVQDDAALEYLDDDPWVIYENNHDIYELVDIGGGDYEFNTNLLQAKTT